MADALSRIMASESYAQDASPLERQDTGKLSVKGEGSLANGGKLAARVRNPAAPASAQSNGESKPGKDTNTESRAQQSIDPLSQLILQRTNTSLTVQKLRAQNAETGGGQSPTSPQDGRADTKLASDTPTREIGSVGAKADKKKGVSFLSRFIGTKKKGTLDDADDNGSQAGDWDPRPEGMDAQLFSHTVDNLGFSPKHPPPPAYIKMRSKYKKEKEFDRVFLAQELRTKTEKKRLSVGTTSSNTPSGAAGIQNPIWATEFSKDGRYLAAGGQDRVVRVWAVLGTAEDRRAHETEEHNPNASGHSTRLSAPVFHQKPFREYLGHTSTILDLSWSKNNFLLSSSMDKTVRLWHISRSETLCTFKHNDFVPSIQFHPRDDRFFLAGSLDTKLRLWSIPDKSVAYTVSLPDMITSVAFTPDGKTCIAGTLGGLCMFYDTEGLKWQSQIHVKSTRGQNAKGSKITGIQAIYWPPGSSSGEVKLLITSNDSRVRLYGFREKNLEMKFRGHENNCSQIRATFAEDTEHIICGSEDRKAYIWSTNGFEGEKRNQRPMEMFEAHCSITTCATIAPLKTRQLLGASEDPIFDLCNPPPVTLVSREDSLGGSKAPTEAGSVQPTPTEANFRKVAESPAYLARSAHTDGHIIVTADYNGAIKVYRQDCAYQKRLRATDNWDAASRISRRTGSMRLGRPSSVISTRTGRNRRDSTSTQPADERIMTWRQDLAHGGFESSRRSIGRSISPRKNKSRTSMTTTRPSDSPALGPMPSINTTVSGPSGTPKTSFSIDRSSTNHSNPASDYSTPSKPARTPEVKAPPQQSRRISNFDPIKPIEKQPTPSFSNPLSVYNGQSWAFWNTKGKVANAERNGFLAPQGDERPELSGRNSVVSHLSSEISAEEEKCVSCGGTEFRVRWRGTMGKEEKVAVCTRCNKVVE